MIKSRQSLIAIAAAVALVAPLGALAADKSDHAHESAKGGMAGPSMEMRDSMMKGMKEMQGMKPSGDMDRDFAMMMRHHHQQGVLMAQYELQHGKDQKMRDMAQKIADSQKREIAEFDEWLKATRRDGGRK